MTKSAFRLKGCKPMQIRELQNKVMGKAINLLVNLSLHQLHILIFQETG
jgi:hypothetical protein